MKTHAQSPVLSALQSARSTLRLLAENAGNAGECAEEWNDGGHARETAKMVRAAIEQCEAREKAFADMLAALERVAEMTCEDTGRNFDEWGEAACFTDCQKIARETLASVKGRAS